MIHDKYLIPGGTIIIDFPTGEIPALTTLYARATSPPLLCPLHPRSGKLQQWGNICPPYFQLTMTRVIKN